MFATAKRGSSAAAVLNLTATTLGAGLLAIPRSLAMLGVLWGTAAIILIAIASDLTLGWLVKCSRYSGRKSYEGNAAHFLGRSGAFALHAFLIILLFGASIAMIVIFVDTIPIEGVSREKAVIAFAFLSYPIAVSEELSSLKWVSALSLCCLGFFYLLLLSRFSTNPISSDVNWSEPPESIKSASIALSVILSSFICHFNIFKIDVELGDANSKHTDAVIHFSMLGVCLIVYLTVGLAGYLLLGPNVPANILIAFPNDYLFRIAKGALCLTNFFKFPLLLVPLRESIVEGIPADKQALVQTGKGRMVLTAFLVIIVSFVAYYLTDLMKVLSLLGSSAGVVTGFLLPSLLKISLGHRRAAQQGLLAEIREASFLNERITTESQEWNVLPGIIAILSVIVGCVSTYYSLG